MKNTSIKSANPDVPDDAFGGQLKYENSNSGSSSGNDDNS